MIYALQKIRHYLSGSRFKFFTDHSTLKYLVNKLVLEGRICRWLLLFQEFSFEFIIKPGLCKCNIGPDHLSALKSGESGGAVDDQLPDADLFRIEAIPEYLEDIAIFLSIGACPETYSATQKRHMVVRATDYQLIAGQLCKLGLDNILDPERHDILWECHNGIAGGHVGGKEMTQKVLQAGLWWATLFKDAKAYSRSCDVCQRVGKPSRRDELPLQLVRALHAFEKWAVDFVGPINPIAKHSRARYIITATDYLNRWAEATVVQECSTDTVARFIFENIITHFGCPRSLTNNQGAHFISSTIATLTAEFLIQHHKSSPYHP
jgi:hypothetical protein